MLFRSQGLPPALLQHLLDRIQQLTDHRRPVGPVGCMAGSRAGGSGRTLVQAISGHDRLRGGRVGENLPYAQSGPCRRRTQLSNGGFASDETYKLVCSINTFRNEYVAHEKKELTDSALAKAALATWAGGLVAIWRLHSTK